MKPKFTKTQIRNFFNSPAIAVIGASATKGRFGYTLFNTLKSNGYNVVPVNPKYSEIDGVKCYPNVDSLPNNVMSALIVINSKGTLEILNQVIQKGIEKVWIQQHSESKEAIKLAEKFNLSLIYGLCAFMFTEPVTGVHKFHRNLKFLFRKMPE